MPFGSPWDSRAHETLFLPWVLLQCRATWALASTSVMATASAGTVVRPTLAVIMSGWPATTIRSRQIASRIRSARIIPSASSIPGKRTRN